MFIVDEDDLMYVNVRGAHVHVAVAVKLQVNGDALVVFHDLRGPQLPMPEAHRRGSCTTASSLTGV